MQMQDYHGVIRLCSSVAHLGEAVDAGLGARDGQLV